MHCCAGRPVPGRATPKVHERATREQEDPNYRSDARRPFLFSVYIKAPCLSLQLSAECPIHLRRVSKGDIYHQGGMHLVGGDLTSDLENNAVCDYRVQHALGPTVQQRICGQPVSAGRPQIGRTEQARLANGAVGPNTVRR
jgi:hypothetical protein